ncbi:hypothetical protein [Paenibacillus sp. y28]|uniref:hypothetical protein n=1 Tax=Paenibacillus sp. y28 TaxID=3129110 RepID=UPI00301B4ED3
MGITIAIVVLLLMIGLVWLGRSKGKKWEAVLVQKASHSSEAEEQYELLKKNSLRCRLRSADGFGSGAVEGSGQKTVRLEVHHEDVPKARELLEQYAKEVRTGLRF